VIGRGTLERAACAAGLVLTLAAVPASQSARAQSTEPAAFGGYQLTASGVGFSLAPTLPAVLPVDVPAEATLALAFASLSTGGQGYGQASSVFPGTLLTGLRPLLATAAGIDLPIPDYPLVVSTRQHEAARSSRLPGITMSSNVTPEEAIVTSDLGGFTIPGILDIGAVRSTSTAKIEPGRATASSTTEVTGVSLLAGMIHIDSIVSTSTAETDATTGTCGGGVRIAGATLNDTAITIDEDGVSVDGPPLIPGLDLNAILLDLLDAAGVEIRLLGGTESCDTARADRSTAGLLVSLPVPELGPLPPGGSIDLFLAGTSATAGATEAFVAPTAPPPTIAPTAPVGGFGPVPAPATGDGIDLPPVSAVPTTTPEPAPPTAPSVMPEEPLDYDFAGVPAPLVAGLMLLAIPGGRRVRRYMDRVLSTVAAR
jgi:hypothetical protein